jgi:hypothetical protein
MKYVMVPAQVHKLWASMNSQVLLRVNHTATLDMKYTPPVFHRIQEAFKMGSTLCLARHVVLLQTTYSILSFLFCKPLGCGGEIWKDKPSQQLGVYPRGGIHPYMAIIAHPIVITPSTK